MPRWTLMLCATLALTLVSLDSADACPKSKPFATWEVKGHRFLKAWAPKLKKLAAQVAKHPGRVLMIAAHSSSRGSSRFNKRLTQRRAQQVKAALVKHGIPKSQIVAKGFGEDCPIASNRTRRGRQQNKRVEFAWKKKK